MFNQLYENIVLRERIKEKLAFIREGRTWEQIALALYTILDDISTADDMCKENMVAFRNMVMKLQLKKNQLLYSPDGYEVKRVDEGAEAEHEMETVVGPGAERKGESKFKEGMKDWQCLECGYRFDKTAPKYGEMKCPKCGSIDIDIDTGTDESKLKENLTDFARNELQIAGLFDEDSDYDGMLGEAVIELINTFAKQGHSGFSASLVRELFSKLSNYKPLTEITNDPDQWNDIADSQSGKLGWQSRRSPSCFSEDAGKTYWDIDEDYFFHTDEDGTRWSGGLSEEEWDKRPMHTSKQVEKEE